MYTVMCKSTLVRSPNKMLMVTFTSPYIYNLIRDIYREVYKAHWSPEKMLLTKFISPCIFDILSYILVETFKRLLYC
jgi:hypothetical protein